MYDNVFTYVVNEFSFILNGDIVDDKGIVMLINELKSKLWTNINNIKWNVIYLLVMDFWLLLMLDVIVNI